MRDFSKLIKGYLTVSVKGFSPERFMNLCSTRGILLWDIQRRGEEYLLNIFLKDFWNIKPLVKKTGVKVVILKRNGLPFFVSEISRRWVFVLCFLLAFSLWFGASFFVWKIELVGNQGISDEELLRFLNAQEIHVGMPKRTVNVTDLEKKLRKEFPEVTWTCARVRASGLELWVKENEKPEMTENEIEHAGQNLISGYKGKIVAMIVRQGVPKVKIGDEVEAGAILVEGRVPVYREDGTVKEWLLVEPDGDVLIEHTLYYQDSLSYIHSEKKYTGREKKEYYLCFAGDALRLPGKAPFMCYDTLGTIKSIRALEIFKIPLYLGQNTYQEYQNILSRYSNQEADELLKKKLMRFLASLDEKGVQIIEKNVKISIEGNSRVLQGDFVVWQKAEDFRRSEESIDSSE